MINDLLKTPLVSGVLPVSTMALNIAVAFVLCLFCALTYRATHRGLSYSQSFPISLIMMGFLVAGMVMVIGNSIALAFAGFGAMSLIRFRTAIKDVRDVAFVLLSVAIGFSSGTGNYGLAILLTIFAIAVIFILHRMNFGSIRKYDYVLSFSAASGQFQSGKLREIFTEFLKFDQILNVVTRENGRVIDHSFNIKFINPDEIEKFAGRVAELPGVSDVDIISAKNDIEY